MADGVATFVVNRWGRIEEVDDDGCALVGYSRDELLRLHGADLILPDERPSVAVSLDRMQRGTLESRPGRLVRKDGSVVSVEVHARPLDGQRLELRIHRTD